MKRRKIPIKKELIPKIEEDATFIGLLAEVMKIKIQYRLVDTKFNKPILNMHVKHIQQGAENLQKELSKDFKHTNEEGFIYDNASALYRVMELFAPMPAEVINKFVDNAEKSRKQ